MKGKTFLVTGGAGFIGSAMVRHLVLDADATVVTVDKLTYAGVMENLTPVRGHAHHHFVHADICDKETIEGVMEQFRPDGVFHFAAESHVDRSIDGPSAFVETNIVGTYELLAAALDYWRSLEGAKAERFRFLHVSTDEVFGSLGPSGDFVETSPYDPRSPYAASKAAADHLTRAWYHTYGLPTLITNTCNNYGPCQFPEKLIPLVIQKALRGDKIPVYGRGDNVRDWIYVDDHVRGVVAVYERGRPGETYNLGARCEMTNLALVQALCAALDDMVPNPEVGKHESLIEFVSDRPGHDFRYAIDPTKADAELGWRAVETFQTGIRRTVRWYLDNPDWIAGVRDGGYGGERLGLKGSAE